MIWRAWRAWCLRALPDLGRRQTLYRAGRHFGRLLDDAEQERTQRLLRDAVGVHCTTIAQWWRRRDPVTGLCRPQRLAERVRAQRQTDVGQRWLRLVIMARLAERTAERAAARTIWAAWRRWLRRSRADLPRRRELYRVGRGLARGLRAIYQSRLVAAAHRATPTACAASLTISMWWRRLHNHLLVPAPVAKERARRQRVYDGWIRLTVKVGLAAAFGSLPDRPDGDGPDPVVLGAYRPASTDVEPPPRTAHTGAWPPPVGHVSPPGGGDVVPERRLPTWLRGGAHRLDPHDSVNCRHGFAGTDLRHEECLRGECDLQQSAADDPPLHDPDVGWQWHRLPRAMRARARHGVRLPFIRDPSPYVREPDANYRSAVGEERVFEEFARLRRRRVLDGPFSVSDTGHITVVQPLGAVEKKGTKKLRLVTDFTASGINGCLPPRPLFLPTMADAIRFVGGGGWYGSKMDMSDAFLCNPVHPIDRRYHAVKDPTPAYWQPQPSSDEAGGDGVYPYTDPPSGDRRDVWVYRRTPFGSSLSPYYFCSTVEPAFEYLRERLNLQVLCFIDDVLCLGGTRARVRATETAARAAMDFLGVRENTKKYERVSTTWNWLGLDVDSRLHDLVVRYPADKQERLVATLDAFADEFPPGSQVPRKRIAQLAGKLTFASYGVSGGNLFLPRLYDALHDGSEHLSLHQRLHMLGRTVPSPGFYEDLQWWRDTIPRAAGRRYHPPGFQGVLHIFGDASSAGRGAVFYSDSGAQTFSEAWDPHMQVASSNLRELSTLADAIRVWGEQFPPGSRILYSTDNSTTAAAIRRGYCRHDETGQLSRVTREILSWGAEHSVEIWSRWIPGTAIIEQGADGLSREDRFERLPPVAWQAAPEVSRHWESVTGIVPEVPIIPTIGRRLREALAAYEADPSATQHVFCVPDWPTASWFPLLKRFRALHRYAAGSQTLAHPDRPSVPCAAGHPSLVISLGTSDAPLSRSQRRQGRRVGRA